MSKINKIINICVIISLLLFVYASIIVPMMYNKKIVYSMFDTTILSHFAVFNEYADQTDKLSNDDFETILNDSDLIIRAKLADVFAKYPDYPISNMEIVDIIKGEYSDKFIDVKDHVIYYYDNNTDTYCITNISQYLSMNSSDEYYLLLKYNSAGFYELSNIEFGRINVDGDKIFTFDDFYELNNQFNPQIDSDYDFVGFINFAEGIEGNSEIYEFTNLDYNTYLENRDKLRLILLELEKRND